MNVGFSSRNCNFPKALSVDRILLQANFSNEKVPGEGEHKIIDYIRKNNPYDSYCIYGADADLFMLSLSS